MTMYYRLYSKSDLFIINCQSSLWHFKSGIIWLFFFNFPEYKRWAVKCFIYFTFFVHEIFRIHFYLFCKCEIGIYMQLTQNCDCNSGYWKFNRSKRAVAWNFYSLFAQASFYARLYTKRKEYNLSIFPLFLSSFNFKVFDLNLCIHCLLLT